MKRASEEVIEPTAVQPPWPDAWTPEGVIELLEPMVSERRCQRIQSVTRHRLESVTVVMDAPHDPHNGAAVLRSADAFGVQQVHVVPRIEPFLVSSAVAKGTEHWVDIVAHPSAEQAVAALQAAGYELVATHPKGELEPEQLATLPRLALILGNEHDGICRALERAASRSVRIGMKGYVESLNVSVSAAILLFLATRNRTGDLPTAARRILYARGLFRSVPRAGEILSATPPR